MINTNSTGAYFERSLFQMGDLRQSIERFQTQIATGERFVRGSDDPVATSRLRSLDRIEARGEAQQRNALRLAQDLGQGASQIEGVTGLLQRARELAVAASSDTVGARGREAIALEISQLEEELFARANSLSITGSALFAGTGGAPAFVRDAAGTVGYTGTGESGAVPIAPSTEIERGLPGDQVFEFDVDGTATSAFAVLSGFVAALRATGTDPVATAQDALRGIDAAIETANRSQTVIGTRLAWVETIQQDQQANAVSVAEKRSQIGDTDLSDAIVRLQRSMTALDATQATFARVSSLTLFDAF